MSFSPSAPLTQPAEWTPHAACWLAWPSHEDLWLENLAPAREAFVALCAAIADPDPKTGSPRGERLEILVPNAAQERAAMEALAKVPARFHRVPFGDIWLRDTAPIFVHDARNHLFAARFGFNGWGGKYVLEHDETVSTAIASASGVPSVQFPWILEGGSVELDGEGTCLTTRQCLLNPNRNAHMDERAIAVGLRNSLGAQKVLWLHEGLKNDHTDGHIDTLARFIQPGVVVCMEPRTSNDPHREILRAIITELGAMVDAHGRRLEVVRMPSPGHVTDETGHPMPASYANFYIGNRTVVVPTYGSAWDAEAVAQIAALFPNRNTVGVEARAILSGGGAFHCITQQQPEGVIG